MQLKRQAAVHSEHLTDVLHAQESMLHKQYTEILENKLVDAKDDMREEISSSTTKLKAIEQAIDGKRESG